MTNPQSLLETLAEGLREAGIDAVDARAFRGKSGHYEATFDKALADGQTLVVWDVEFVDARQFRLPDGIRFLVVRFDPGMSATDLARSVADILASLKAEGAPHQVVVLEPTRQAAAIKSQSKVRKSAA